MRVEELAERYEAAYNKVDFEWLASNMRQNNLTREQLFEKISTLSEAEITYKQYYERKTDLESARRFLETLDPDFLIANGLQFPELGLFFSNTPQGKNTEPYQEYHFFNRQHISDVIIMKHPNYSPSMPHHHSFFEMLYVLKGRFPHTVSEQKFFMEEGDLCILAPGVTHDVEVFDDSTILINILIRRSTFEDVFRNILPNNNILTYFFLDNLYDTAQNDFVLFHTKGNDGLREIIWDMFLEYENKQAYFSTITNSSLITFLGRLLREYESDYVLPPYAAKFNTRYYELIHYMHEHYKDATLYSVAEHFHYSCEYASRLIKQACGMNFSDLQRKLRLEQACLWLKKTNLSIGLIAENVGYLNKENFNRMFRKEFNMSPREWRSLNADITVQQ